MCDLRRGLFTLTPAVVLAAARRADAASVRAPSGSPPVAVTRLTKFRPTFGCVHAYATEAGGGSVPTWRLQSGACASTTATPVRGRSLGLLTTMWNLAVPNRNA